MSKQANVKAYPKDFKEQVVKLAQVGDHIAREFRDFVESVRRWVKQVELDQGSRTNGLRSEDRDEMARCCMSLYFGQMLKIIPREGRGAFLD